jgi:hypothetical protein
MACRPTAPALAQDRASDWIVSTRLLAFGGALSKTIALRCFQSHHTVSITSDYVPLCRARGVDRIATNHHSTKSSSSTGGPAVDLIQDNTSYQIALEKEQPVRRWCMVSPTWSQSGQRGGWGSPLLASLPPVQQRSKQASQTKNLTRGGAQERQFSFQ